MDDFSPNHDGLFSDEQPESFMVEFFGGPFDGLTVQVHELPEGVVMPVNTNTMQRANGGPQGPPSPPSSVAFYQRIDRHGRWAYQHLASTSANQADLRGWMA